MQFISYVVNFYRHFLPRVKYIMRVLNIIINRVIFKLCVIKLCIIICITFDIIAKTVSLLNDDEDDVSAIITEVYDKC